MLNHSQQSDFIPVALLQQGSEHTGLAAFCSTVQKCMWL